MVAVGRGKPPGAAAALDRQRNADRMILPDRFQQVQYPGADFGSDRQIRRSTIIFLISAIALAGFSPLGQACVQFMIVWQR